VSSVDVAEPLRVRPGNPGSDALRMLPSRLLRESSAEQLGADVVLREFADPPRAAFLLPPTDAIAVILVTRGDYVLETGKGRARSHAVMAPGSSSVTRPGREVHARWRSSGSEPFRSMQLHASREVLERVGAELQISTRRQPDYLHRGDAFLAASVRQIGSELRTGAPRLHLDTLVRVLLEHLLLHGEAEGRSAPRMSARALSEVLDLMRERLDDDLALDELAAAAHLSPHHFLRRFTAATGTTPVRYLTRLRMERAMDLLRTSTLPIEEVGRRCGYSNPSAFSAAFRRHAGRTPTEHRRMRPT
jgi:AraC family transcriptional regulator